MLRSPREAYDPTTLKSWRGGHGGGGVRGQGRAGDVEGREWRGGERDGGGDGGAAVVVATPRSLRSLYDDGGFLRSSPSRGLGV